MRDEIPAALPLTALVAGITFAHFAVNMRVAACGGLVIGLLALSRRWRAVATFALFASVGIFLGSSDLARRAAEDARLRSRSGERFATVSAEIDRGWSKRGTAWMLRVSRFTVDGHTFEQPLRIYVRFEPPEIGTAAMLTAEGFVKAGPRGATMTVKSPRLLQFSGALDSAKPSSWNRLAALRSAEFAPLYPDAVALAEAIVLGRGERLSDELHQSFRRGGTYHLLVFSGLQISFAAAVFALVLRWLRAPRMSDWLLLTFASLAPLFIGHTPSVARASIVIGLYALSRIAGRPTTFENLWCLSALVRLIVTPGDLLDAGFHLTYAGAGALLFVARPFAPKRARWVAYAIAAEIVLAPITLFYFHQFALGGSIATLAMTPLIFMMLILSATFFLSGQEWLLVTIEWLHYLCTKVNDAGAVTSGFFAAPPLWSIIGAAAISLIAMVFLTSRPRAGVIALAFALAVCGSVHRHWSQRSVDGLLLQTLDVGQGDASLLRHGSTAILVDGGGRNDDLRFGESTLLPLLVDRGVRRLDAVVLTHTHPDHCGGLPAVVDELTVNSLWISPRQFRGDCASRLLDSANGRRVPIRLLKRNESRAAGHMVISTILPTRTFRRASENNASVVLRVAAEGRRILLTGDVEREAEIDLLDQDLRADVLKVPHHGSRSSSLPMFLSAVQPTIGLISAGRGNLFNHPHPELLERLAERRIRVLRTDVSGTVSTRIKDGRISIVPEIDTPR